MPLQIVRADITTMDVDAVVNTTNSEMTGYSGVDLAVHRAAGPALEKECRRLVPLETGKAKITKGYKLRAKYIIHTSGPVWKGGDSGEEELLRQCYTESLRLAVKRKCRSLAFPLISSGTYGFPKDMVLKFAVQVIREFLLEHELMVYLCVFDRTSYQFSRTLFSELSSFLDSDEDEDFFDEIVVGCPDTAPAPVRLSAAREYEKRAEYSAPFTSSEVPCGSAAGVSLQEYMKSLDKPFALRLFELIDSRGMTDVECYKKANVDKKTFSKIKCHPEKYRPSKQTAVAFAIALRLNLDETQELLESAGLTLSRSFVFDKIIRYFIQKGIYDIYEINEALFEFDQVLLGC